MGSHRSHPARRETRGHRTVQEPNAEKRVNRYHWSPCSGPVWSSRTSRTSAEIDSKPGGLSKRDSPTPPTLGDAGESQGTAKPSLPPAARDQLGSLADYDQNRYCLYPAASRAGRPVSERRGCRPLRLENPNFDHRRTIEPAMIAYVVSVRSWSSFDSSRSRRNKNTPRQPCLKATNWMSDFAHLMEHALARGSTPASSIGTRYPRSQSPPVMAQEIRC